MKDNFNLFTECKKGNSHAQRMLYDLFKGSLMGLCRRYARSREEAQDVLQETFVKIFSKIHQVQSSEKLESWMKSIAVRTAIDQYYKTKTKESLFQTSEWKAETDIGAKAVFLNEVTDEYLLTVIQELPAGCGIIFNMFEIEGYGHAEISEMLEISEGTSRSQLHRAKQLLREKLKSQTLAEYYEKLG
jgi:RNA polymerase sigma factor (sigma-70 family)